MKKIKINLGDNGYYIYREYQIEKLEERFNESRYGRKVLILSDKMWSFLCRFKTTIREIKEVIIPLGEKEKCQQSMYSLVKNVQKIK